MTRSCLLLCDTLSKSRVVWECSSKKMGGKFHLRLNIGERPIANKYREGKMKRTLKRELKSTWNCWKGNIWNQSLQAGNQLGFCRVHFPVGKVSVSFWLPEKIQGNVAPIFFGSVIALEYTVAGTEERRACSGFWCSCSPPGGQLADRPEARVRPAG